MLPNELIMGIFMYLSPTENVRLIVLSKEIRDIILFSVLPNSPLQTKLIQVTRLDQNSNHWIKIQQSDSVQANSLNAQLFAKHQVLIHLFQQMLRWLETKSEMMQIFYKESFFNNFLQYEIISPNLCQCEFYLFVSSRKPSYTSKSLNDHYLFCPIHKCFLNFHLLHGCHTQVFKTIINPMNPVFFDTRTIFGNFTNLSGALFVYDSFKNENRF